MIVLQDQKIKLEIEKTPYREIISVFNGNEWKQVFRTCTYAVIVSDHRKFNIYFRKCEVREIENLPGSDASSGVRIRLEHADYYLTRVIWLDDAHLLHFEVELTAKKDLRLRAIEDEWELLEEKHHVDTPLQGPLDFVWSQRVKLLPACFVSHYNFRTPVQIFQQNGYCAAIIAGLEGEDAEKLEKFPLGFDMNVTEHQLPWMSYGIIASLNLMPNWPCEPGHSMIVRGCEGGYLTICLTEGESVGYRYTVQAFYEEGVTGYQSVLRYVWDRYYAYRQITDHGAPAINERYPDAKTFEDWEQELYEKKLVSEFFVDENNPQCGGVRGFRQGDWFSRTDNQHDVWYACWLQEFVTGYGMYLYDKRRKNLNDKGRKLQLDEQSASTAAQGGMREDSAQQTPDFCDMACKMLDFLLSAPRQKDGFFPVICYVEKDGSRTWLNDDGWAGYYTDYHTMMMSWNGYLMLLWGKELFPEKQDEILAFLLPYGEFLLKAQQESGNIPAWWGEDGKPSRDQFRDFNAETAVSAAFLLELGDVTGRKEFLDAGLLAIDFLNREVRPRQRWFDMETFKSCSQKAYAFYDSITAQYPQCNLSMIYAVIAYLKQYELYPTQENKKDLVEVADYLLLYQQLWNHPAIECDVFGGFTVQNTDNEWSDIREGLAAILMYRVYEVTQEWEYMERAVTAMQSCFPPLPYENWAHCGYESMQYDSSLLWGGGVAMTAGEYFREKIGDAAFDLESGKGIAFFGTYALTIRADGDKLLITAEDGLVLEQIRIYHADRSVQILINGMFAGDFTKEELSGKISVVRQA